jgi:hypothetical protein
MGDSLPDATSIEAALSEEAIEAIVAEEERLAKEHARRAEGWRLILQGRRYLSGNVEAAVLDQGGPENGRPTNFEAVLRIVATDPTKVWTPPEIMDALAERGWTFRGKMPRKTLGATLSVLTSRGRLKKAGRGRYKLPLAPTDENQLFHEGAG